MKTFSNTFAILLFSALLLMSMSGCSSLPKYAKEATYSPPTLPSSNEVLLYMFREDTIVGGGVSLTFVADDTVVGALDFGSFSYVKLPATKPYEVALIANENFDEPKYHYRLDDPAGKTVYIMWNNELGERGFGLHAIDKSTAEKLMQTYVYRELKFKGEKIGVSYNKYFDKLFAGDKNLPVINNDKITKHRPLAAKATEEF
jgi:hypothetical protein